jgi:endonuclease-3
MAKPRDVPEIARRLEEAEGRPTWEPELDALAELVQTILSQHTAWSNSRRAFERLRMQFPTWEQLAEAPVELVEEAIRPAGLARLKAPRIKGIVQRVIEECGEPDLDFLARLPRDEALAWLRRLPGVGYTTAACVLLFGLGQPVMPVDTGIERVARRLGLADSRHSADDIGLALEGEVPAGDVYPLHVNLIRFAREVCRPREPSCVVCVLNDLCATYARYRPEVSQPRTRAHGS